MARTREIAGGRARPGRRRPGFTLIEMLVVMSVMSVVMVIGTLTIVLMLRSERSGSRAMTAAIAAHRLARQFRDDVHAAVSARIDIDPQSGAPQLILAAHGGPMVRWTEVEGGVRRNASTKPPEVETYRIPDAVLRFTVPGEGNAGQAGLIRITLVPETDNPVPDSAGLSPVVATAILGHDARHRRRTGQGGRP